MDQILQQVARARCRLSWELFLQRLIRCWFFALVAAGMVIGISKFAVEESLPQYWPWICIGGSLAIGLLAAGVWMWVQGRSRLEAAMEIDRRYGLRERIASSLALSPEHWETPAGQALLADAGRAIRRVDIGERFKVRLGKRPWLPLVPALIVFLLITLVDHREAQSHIDPQAKPLTKKQLDDTAKALRERMIQQRKKAAKYKLKEAEALFREVEKSTEKLAKTDNADRKKVLVKLSDLGKRLEQRRQQLGGEKEMRKQMANMKNLNRGPADKMLEAMKQGDWQKAMQELKKIQKKLEGGKLDKQAKKQLEKQLQQLQEKMAQAAQARQQAMEDLKKQIEKQKQEGNLSRAGELQQKLDQMQKQKNQMQGLNKMAQKMGECQQCMQQGDNAGAAKALGEMMQQMEQMEKNQTEAAMLEEAMDQLEMAKGAMAENAPKCGQCQGQGCQGCMGGRMGNQVGKRRGNGMGEGLGGGKRPDEKNDTRFRDSRVQQNARGGAAVIAGEIDGPNVRGKVAESIKEEMATQGSEPADPLVAEQLPKSRREHAEQYFNGLRDDR